MKLRFALLFLVAICVTLAAVPGVAQGYENGPVNGTTDAWGFTGGFQNTQSFTAISTISSFSGWFWIAPGDSLTGVQLSIGTAPFGTDVFNTNLGAPATSNCFTNTQYGYNVCNESWAFNGPAASGNYWLTLQNGTTALGTQPFWDENSGIGCHSTGCPSTAMLNEGIGTIPSGAFTIGNLLPPQCLSPTVSCSSVPASWE